MKEDKDSRAVSSEADQDFLQFLRQVRKEENVRLEQLAEGLMTVSHLARIEKGQRPICKNMRDRLLGRLGVASDLYENLLNIEDYIAWQQQRNILSAIERRDFEKAQELLDVYAEQKPRFKDKIKQQFCLVMRAELLKQQNADQNEIGACYERAAKLTISDVEKLCFEQRLLSIQEVNLVLEYWFYHKDETFAQKCRELMAFVENAVYDDLSKVKIYPKIVYYYLQEVLQGDAGQVHEDHGLDNLPTEVGQSSGRQIQKCPGDSLTVCNRAIEMLRDTGRAYYLLELLEMRIRILECGARDCGEERQMLQESRELAELLRNLYTAYEVPAYMQDCAYLYQQRWVFYIGDVLRIRRNMYGWTQQQLCDGICSAKTLRRTERMQANMQQDVQGLLLRRLGLSKEYQRTSLVTSDREVVKLNEKLAVCRNNHEIERTRMLLQQIENRISMEIPVNRQYVKELKASLDWMEGSISREEFVTREEEALQCTLDIDNLFHKNEIYLTEMEMVCIRKIIQGLEGLEKRKYIDLIMHFFEPYEDKNMLSDCIIMYEYVMIHVASELGNMGELQASTEVHKKVLGASLMCRRVWEGANNLYSILWNDEKKKNAIGQFIRKEKMIEGLKQCIILNHFCKQSYGENFLCEKMHQV